MKNIIKDKFVIEELIYEIRGNQVILDSDLARLYNSFILCLIDLLRPNLDWNGEYAILKNNKSKLLQYILIIFNIIALKSVNNMFKGYKLDVSLCIFHYSHLECYSSG